MTIIQELRSLAPMSADATESQLRRAIGYLKCAYQNPPDLLPSLQCLFMEDVEKICADLNLWLEAMKSKELH